MCLKILLALTILMSLFSQTVWAEKCPNPKNCEYTCHNGWAYDPNEWYLTCDGNVWDPTGVLCSSSNDKPRSYCNPPRENSASYNKSEFLSSHTFAQNNCHGEAQKAAFKYAVENDYVTSINEFRSEFGNENLETKDHSSWKKEFWAFGNGSKFIFVTVDSIKSECFVKEISWGQDDQDQE